MRADVTFDTLSFMETLKKSGMPQEQAEALTKATVKSFHQLIDFQEIINKRAYMHLKNDLMRHITYTMWKTVGFVAASTVIILFMIGIF